MIKKKEEKKPNKRGVIYKCDAVNIRKQPDLYSDIVGTALANDEVEIIEDAGEWYGIKCGKVKGYTMKLFIAAE